MTENSELRLFINAILEFVERIGNVDIGDCIAFDADDVMVVILFHEFVTLDVIMEIDGRDDALLREEIEFPINRREVE